MSNRTSKKNSSLRNKNSFEYTKRRKISSVNGGYITYVLIGIALFAFLMATGFMNSVNPAPNGTKYVLATPTSYGGYNSLELHTLNFTSAEPSSSSAPQSNFCSSYGNVGAGGKKFEEIVEGYSPPQGQTVSAGGQVKVWVGDENPPCVGTGEIADATTGVVTHPGNHTELFGFGNGYPWEPALYIGTLSGSGGQPKFPTMIKGTYNNAPKSGNDCKNNINQLNGPAMDPIQSNSLKVKDSQYQAEYIWDVNSLGLGPGTYPAEFIIHDGDAEQGGYCVTISIQ